MQLYVTVLLIIGVTVAVASSISERDVQKIEGQVKDVIDKASSGGASPDEIKSRAKQIKAQIKTLPKDDRHKVKSYALHAVGKVMNKVGRKRMDRAEEERQKRFLGLIVNAIKGIFG